MKLEELINRSDTIPIEEKEAYFILKEYVKVRKNVDINPKIESRLGTFNTLHEVNLMHDMLNIAIGWFRQNPDVL